MAMKKLNENQERKQYVNESEVDLINQPDVQFPEGMESFGVNTTEIKEIWPRPETNGVEVQTQDYIDRPQTPLFIPKKNGEDASTQIERGELFDFDEEVEPIINVLTFKTLEESRMEVLEEDELREMKEQEQAFEKVRNRELEVVQKLENEERRKNEEKARRNLERDVRIKMGKIYQKKWISCMFSKNYWKDLTIKTVSDLEKQGMLRKPEHSEYHTKLLPFFGAITDEVLNTDTIINEEIDDLFENIYCATSVEKHIQSKLKEKQRRDEEERKHQQEWKRQEEERQKRLAERQRWIHQKELEVVKKQIRDTLLVQGLFVDDINEVFEITGYHLKGAKSAQVTGGQIGQIGVTLLILQQWYPDWFNGIASMKEADLKKEMEKEKEKEKEREKDKDKDKDKDKKTHKDKDKDKGDEKKEEQQPTNYEPDPNFHEELRTRIIDLFIIKSHSFYMLYKPEELEEYRQLEPSLNSIDDIYKIEKEENYLSIITSIISKSIAHDEILPLLNESYKKIIAWSEGEEDWLAVISNWLLKIFKICKTTSDFDVHEKIKFIPIEQPLNENYFGICNWQPERKPKQKPQIDITQQLLAKKAVGKSDKPPRPFFDPFWSERSYAFPTYDEKMKVIAINNNYDRIFRWNWIDCIGKIDGKFLLDKEILLQKVEELYDNLMNDFKESLCKKYNKEILDIAIEDVAPQQ